MRTSVQRLRWFLAVGAVLLLFVLAAFLGYGRYRALTRWRRFIQRAGVHISHETDGFTYSQSVQGRTVFTVHAAKAIQHGDGKWSLHDAVLTMYGKSGDTVDHVRGKDFEYDENTGVARALGEVLMDLQAPGSSGASARRASAPGDATSQSTLQTAPDDRVIHVRTSGLVYVRKLSVAATEQPVEFVYQGLTCLAKGAEFDSGESILRLLADVHVNGLVPSRGQARGQPIDLRASKADLDRTTNVITLADPVASMHGDQGRAAAAVMHMRKDGSIERLLADTNVRFDSGTRRIAGSHLDALFSASSQPQSGHLTGGVTIADTDPTRPLQAHADEIDASFNPAGAPTSMVATGAAQLQMTDKRRAGPALSRTLRGDRVVASLQPVAHSTTSRLTGLLVTGSAAATGESLVAHTGASASPAANPPHFGPPQIKLTQVSADNLRAAFTPGSGRSVSLQRLWGQGHARLQEDTPGGARQTSSADALDASFAAQPQTNQGAQMVSVTQTGHVQIHSHTPPEPGTSTPDSDADGDTALYDAVSSKLTISGHANFSQGGTSLSATTIALDQPTGNADAEGAVLATLLGSPTQPPTPDGKPAAKRSTPDAITHVSADGAHLVHSTQHAEFYGTDAHPARLWQGASQVQAAKLLFDQKRRSLAARPAAPGGLVHGVFATEPTAPKPAAQPAPDARTPAAPAQVIRVSSPVMDYSDESHQATFSGGVRIDGSTGQASSTRGVVFFNPPPPPAAAQPSAAPATAGVFGGSLNKLVLTGDVHLQQPGRTGTGDQLVYTAADSSYILTGTPARPPHMVDAQQGSVTGATLLFRQRDSTIVVAGAPASPAETKHTRVRTETEVKQ